MAELFGLVISLVLIALVVLPVLTVVRLGRLSRDLEALAARVRTLEARQRSSPAVDGSPSMQPESGSNAPPDAWPVASAVGEGETAPGFVLASPGTPETEADLEERIGGRGLLYVGILVLLFGVSFFLKYAFDNAWINETGRVVLGAIAGVGLILAGLRLANQGLNVFGQALAGAGLAVLYLAIYAALHFYALVGPTLAFSCMGLVTVAAATVADRQRAQPLAVIAVGGGFLTPFLVGGHQDTQFTLFAYDALLVLGTLLLALRHHWLGLNALSYVLTLVTVLTWTGRYYTDDQWLRTLLFLTLFCVLFLIILREMRHVPVRSRDGGEAAPVATPAPLRATSTFATWLVSALLATAPVFYHVGAVALTASHPPAIHIYLIAFTAAGLWLTADPHRPWLRLLVLLGGFVPLFGTFTLPDNLSWMPPNIVTIIAVAALHTMAILDRIVRQEKTLDGPDLLALHLTGLGLFALLSETLQPIYPDIRGVLAALVSFGACALWQWLATRDRIASMNAAALAFTLAALAIALQFDGPAVVVGWAAQGAAAAWVGLRAPSLAFQYGGLLLWGMAAARLTDGYFSTPVDLVAVLNARSITTAFVVALGYGLARAFHRDAPRESARTRAALHVVAGVLTLMWITAEIQSYWQVRYASAQAYLYEQMLLSLAWGCYGALLIVVGLRRSYPISRYIGITIIVVTALKVLFSDLWELGGLYRVIGFIGFAVLLLLVSYLYQRRRAPTRRAEEAALPPSDAATS